jgi:hypothetical protein
VRHRVRRPARAEVAGIQVPRGDGAARRRKPYGYLVRYGKRLLTRHRILAATGAAAAIVLAAAASYALNPAEHRQFVAAGSNHAAGPSLAGSCISMPLRPQLAAAVHGGASVIVATGTLTGKSVTRKSVTGDAAAAGAPAFYAMTLEPVQTLRGPAIASGCTRSRSPPSGRSRRRH